MDRTVATVLAASEAPAARRDTDRRRRGCHRVLNEVLRRAREITGDVTLTGLGNAARACRGP